MRTHSTAFQMKHLYISDLDKTLLDDDATLSPYAKDELNRMIDNGLQFTIATARSHTSAKHILNGLNIQHPIVVANGSFLADYETGEVLQMQEIGNELKQQLLESILEENIYPFVSAHTGEKLKLFHQDINNPGLQWYLNDLVAANDPRRHYLGHLPDSLDHHIVSMTAIERGEVVQRLGDKLQQQFPGQLDIHYYENPYDEGWFWMSIHDHQATKGNMIHKLLEHQGMNADDITVFGDNVNDIPMFEMAGTSCAVGNAVDILKDKSTHIIGTNSEYGVVRYIKEKFEV